MEAALTALGKLGADVVATHFDAISQSCMDADEHVREAANQLLQKISTQAVADADADDMYMSLANVPAGILEDSRPKTGRSE